MTPLGHRTCIKLQWMTLLSHRSMALQMLCSLEVTAQS